MKRRKWSLVVVLLAAVVVTARAQVDSTQSKLDTLVAGQKQIMAMQEKIYAEVYSEPLADKTAGIEFNPAFLLVQSADDALGLSGGLMLFAVDRKAEIAIPVYYYDKSGKDALTHLNVDLIYRRFIGKHQDGFYFSFGARYTYLKGGTGSLLDFLGLPTTGTATQKKFGAHFGIGYRYFTYSGFFWGTSFYVGRYFDKSDDDIARVGTDDTKMIYDFEILKIGLAF
jgi:hypothetical protein